MKEKYEKIAVVPIQTTNGWHYVDGEVLEVEEMELLLVATVHGMEYKNVITVFDMASGGFITEIPLSDEDVALIKKDYSVTESTAATIGRVLLGIALEHKALGVKKVKENLLFELGRMKEKRPPIYYIDPDDPDGYDQILKIEGYKD